MYELVLERELDRRNFRKRVLPTDLLIETDEVQQDVAHRSPDFTASTKRNTAAVPKAGFNFEL